MSAEVAVDGSLCTAVLDIRETAEVRVVPSCCIPASHLVDRSFELPPRTHKFCVLADETSREGVAYLAKHFTDDVLHVHWAISDFPPARLRDGPLPPADQLQLWCHTRLAEHVLTVLRAHLDSRGGAAAPAPPRLLDAGCGFCRSPVWMLKRMPGLFAVGVDNRAELLLRRHAFVARQGLADRFPQLAADIDTFASAFTRERERASASAAAAAVADAGASSAAGGGVTTAAGAVLVSSGGRLRLRKDDVYSVGEDAAGAAQVVTAAPACAWQPYDAVMLLRFLHRPLLARVARFFDAACGGIVAVEAFHTSSPHPSERVQQLEIGETLEMVSVCSCGGAAAAAAGAPVAATDVPTAAAAAASTAASTGAAVVESTVLLPPAARLLPCGRCTFDWSTAHEALHPTEDGRPLVHVVLVATPKRAVA